MRTRPSATSLIFLALTLAACSDNAEFANPPPQGAQDASDDLGDGSVPDAGDETYIPVPDASDDGAQACDGGPCGDAAPDAEPACGDGFVNPGEVCDDGNSESGDGCIAGCTAIENGFACPEPGKACVSTVVCSDGKVTGNETCDDQNTEAADGCDADCQIEPGWVCPVIGAACEAASCGDGILAGNEQCEDGNVPPQSGDGCDENCLMEPGFKCDVPGQPCVRTVCGDGLAEGSEPCDDGNNDTGDGCTPFCALEPNCSQGACTSRCGDGLRLPTDVAEACDDGNTVAGDGCSPTCQMEQGFVCQDTLNATGATLDLPIVIRDFSVSHPDMEKYLGMDLGIVQAQLGSDRKPVYAGAPTTPTTSGQTNFDQWYRDTAGVNLTVLQTMTFSEIPGGAYQYSNSAFFPIDGQGFGNEGNGHNFHFTSEVRYWFEYKGGEVLDFTGDDDVFVFVNAHLAVNLGGVHGAASGSTTLDAAAAAFGLEVGKVYEIVVFQAERHTSQSNYKLTLSNFTSSRTSCKSVCGDGVLTKDEVCDDGVNTGAYGSCTSDCKARGPYCGDHVVQSAEGEACDDGVNLSIYGGCAPGCKNGASCGDGSVDSLFGEQCDDSVNDGGYGECASGCVLGPRCGDSVVQKADGEQCDDGNSKSGDGCSASCTSEGPA